MNAVLQFQATGGETSVIRRALESLDDNDYRAICAELHTAIQLYTGQNPAAANVSPSELVCRLMDAMAASAAALAQPTPQPVAVSERLPGDVLSWWYEPGEDDDEGYGGKWTLLRIRGAAYTYTHWLPANALPTPEAIND